MSVQTLVAGTPASVSGSFRFEIRANVDLANRAKLVFNSGGTQKILADVRDGNSRIGDATAGAGATVTLVTLTGSGGSARVFDGADRRSFPNPGTGASVL